MNSGDQLKGRPGDWERLLELCEPFGLVPIKDLRRKWFARKGQRVGLYAAHHSEGGERTTVGGVPHKASPFSITHLPSGFCALGAQSFETAMQIADDLSRFGPELEVLEPYAFAGEIKGSRMYPWLLAIHTAKKFVPYREFIRENPYA